MPAAAAAAAAVVLAGGSGTRLGGGPAATRSPGATSNKVYLAVAGRPLVAWALRSFAAVPEIGRLVLVIRPADRELAELTADQHVPRPVEIIEGGPTRHHSEERALHHLAAAVAAGEIDVVAIHDGARPLVEPRLITDALAAARRFGAAIPGLAVPDAAVADAEVGLRSVPADRRLARVQTPQAFRAGPLLRAFEAAALDGFTGTDTAACVERYGNVPVYCLPGDPRNIKVTYRPDVVLAERLLLAAGRR